MASYVMQPVLDGRFIDQIWQDRASEADDGVLRMTSSSRGREFSKERPCRQQPKPDLRDRALIAEPSRLAFYLLVYSGMQPPCGTLL